MMMLRDYCDRIGSGAANALLGPPAPTGLPGRVTKAIRIHEERSEVLICLVQFAAIVFFAVFYTMTPKGFGPDVKFEPVPMTLAAYALFTGVRLWLALRGSLTPAFLALSIFVDVAVLMITIWSFHLQYGQPASAYLKAPTLLYVFIIIGLRALRFEPIWALLAGATAAAGWLLLVLYAIKGEPMSTMLTHSFAEYTMSNKLLLGAEVDKMVSILVVTMVLGLAIERARRTLIRAVVEGTAASELSRFFAPDIAATIVGAPERIEPGIGVTRHAAIMFIDLRGFTALANTVEPQTIVGILSEYHAVVLPVIRRHHGAVITYLGDGIMITFGAVQLGPECAADAMRATEELISELAHWAEARRTSGLPLLRAGIGVTYGPVVVGAIGTEGRLEYATIGDPVNRAARLQGLTKTEAVPALIAAEAWETALSQRYEPQRNFEQRNCSLAGIPRPVSVYAMLS